MIELTEANRDFAHIRRIPQDRSGISPGTRLRLADIIPDTRYPD